MSETIRRANHGKEHPYYLATRASAQDKEISYEASGMLQYLLSKPNDWRVQPKDLVRKDCGRDKVYKILNELIKGGYIERIYNRDEKGRIVLVEYVVDEVKKPLPENPDMEKPDLVNPYLANPHITEYRIDSVENEQNTLNASLEGVPSSSALDVPIPVQSKTLPPHMMVSIQQAVSVEPVAETPIALDHPLAKLYMDTFGLYKLTKQEVNLLSSKIYVRDDAGEHNYPPLAFQWEKTTGFDEFVKERFAMAARAGNMKPVNVLENLRKFKKEGKWLGWLLWKDKNPSVTKTRKPNEPPKIEYREMPDEAPLPWEAQS